MSNNINVNNNVNRYNVNTRTVNNTISTNNTNASNKGTDINNTNANTLQKSSADNMLDTLGLGGLGLDGLLGGQGAQGTEGLAQMLQMGMFSKIFGGGEGSDSGGFQMVLGALTKALNEKQQASKIGLDSNTKYDGVHINEMTLRSLGTTGTTQNINAAYSNKTEGERIEAAISAASKKHGIDEGLIRAIIKIESDFNPRVKSSAGAMGLMQLMPENVQYYGVKDPYNIEENIDAGTRHIKDYLKMHNNNLDMALAAYNFGPGNMNRRGIKSEADFYKLPTETRNYLVKIRKYYNA